MIAAMSAWLLVPGFRTSSRRCVGGAQQNPYPLQRGNHLPGADQLQHVFRLVRQLANLHQVKEARSSFDRMHGPKDTVYQFLVDLRSTLFDGKKVGLNVRQVLAALGQIILSQLVVKIDHRFVLQPSLLTYPSGPFQSALEALELLDCARQKLAARVQLPGGTGPFYRQGDRAQTFCGDRGGRSLKGVGLQPGARGIRLIQPRLASCSTGTGHPEGSP